MVNILAGYWRAVTGFSRDIWLLIAVMSCVGFGYFGVLGVLLNLFLLRLGYGPTFIGLLIGSGQLLWAALALPAAAVGLRIGPRNAMASGLTLIVVGSVSIVLVQALPTAMWSVWLVASWMVLWSGAALLNVNNIPYMMALGSEEERSYAFAAQSSGLSLAAFLGSVIAGLLVGVLGRRMGYSLDEPAAYRWALFLAPLAFALAAVLVLRIRPVTLPRPDRSPGTKSPRPTRILLFLALTIFLIAAVEGSMRAFFNVYLDTSLAVATVRIGWIMGVGQLLPAAAALTAPVLIERLGPGRTFSLTSLAAGLFMLPLIFIAHWVAAAISFVGIVGATATSGPARNIFGQICLGPEWRATASAAMTIGLGLGWATVAASGGVIVGRWGFDVFFALVALFGLLNALLLTLYLRRTRLRVPAAATST